MRNDWNFFFLRLKKKSAARPVRARALGLENWVKNFRSPPDDRSPNVGCSRVGDGERSTQHTSRHARRDYCHFCPWKNTQFLTWNWHLNLKKNQDPSSSGKFLIQVGFCFDGIFSVLLEFPGFFFEYYFSRAPMEHLFSKTWQTFPLGQEVWGKQGTKRLICSCLGENIALILTNFQIFVCT